MFQLKTFHDFRNLQLFARGVTLDVDNIFITFRVRASKRHVLGFLILMALVGSFR